MYTCTSRGITTALQAVKNGRAGILSSPGPQTLVVTSLNLKSLEGVCTFGKDRWNLKSFGIRKSKSPSTSFRHMIRI